MRKGCFISFEGMDGAGKSTQIVNLSNYLRDKGHNVILTREPGGTEISEQIRNIILDIKNDNMDYMTEALLYSAARAQLMEEVILPALEGKCVVIIDRFVDSSVAYQGYGRELGEAVIEINRYAIKGIMPDITFYLRADYDDCFNRIKNKKKDRIENEETDFFERVYEGYEEIARRNSRRVVVIDAARDVDDISNEIIDRVSNYLNLL